ncbi:hypothetical protein [Streptomyces sp. NPDC006510]|uniref:hypothetical protein n=1 Tax=Streptomyces sp. NPDC006510 TaxID=3155600 RepID=UPI0033B5AD3B
MVVGWWLLGARPHPESLGHHPSSVTPTASRRGSALAQQKVRRGFLTVLWVPIVTVVVLGLSMVGLHFCAP